LAEQEGICPRLPSVSFLQPHRAALLAFSAFSELKHIYLADEDMNPFDIGNVMWAMTPRLQGDTDIITIPGVCCHPLDPSKWVQTCF